MATQKVEDSTAFAPQDEDECNERLSNAHSIVVGDSTSLKQKDRTVRQHNTHIRWLQVLSAFFMNFNSWGIINTYGVFLSYYQSTLLPSHSLSALSWIGTLQAFLLLFVAVIVGPLFDRGHGRALVIAGSFLVVFGMMMTSLATQYYQIILAQGLVVGLGAACLFTSSISNVQVYFQQQRALATGITSCGGSIGGIIYSITTNQLLTSVGFPWTCRIVAFISLGTAVLSIALFRPHPSIGQKKARQLVDLSALCLVSFDVFCFSLFCLYTGLYIPFLYASLYSQTKLHISAALSFDMVTFLNVGAIVGRVVGGYIADRFRSSLLLQTACAAVAGVLTFCWVAISDTAGMVVFCVLYGACQGIIVALPPAIIASMVPDPTKTGTWIGTGMMFSGLGVLLGSPIAGVLVSTDGGGFVGAQAFAGGVIMLGVVALCIFRMV